MILSASQAETFDRCQRLWWLTKAPKGPKIKEPKRGTQEFGTALHGVIERWLKSDVLENDLTLYPEGWASEVSVGDAALIKELFKMAVDQGVIARLPGQLIEYEFTEEIFPGEVSFTGKIDIISEEGITDHKSTKAMKYAKTPDALRTNGQMLSYAMVYLDRKHKRGEPFPKTILLQHNVFSKDPGDKRIKIVRAFVTPDEVISYWQGILTKTIPEMQLVNQAETWYEIPDPPDKHEACNAFGGCTFRALCGRQESIETTIRRLTPKQKDTPTMSLMDRIKANQPGSSVPRAPMSINPPTVIASAVPNKIEAAAIKQVAASNIAQPPERPDFEAPPWAMGTCQACEGFGFNSRGNPCRICDQTRAQMNGIESKMFVVSTDNEGNATWEPRPEWAVPLSKLDPEAFGHLGKQNVTGPTKARVVVTEELGEEIEEEFLEDPTDTARIEAALPEPIKRGPGRPRKNAVGTDVTPDKTAYLMFLGCRRVSGNGSPIYMEEIVSKFGAELAKAAQKNSFYEWDVWARRDALAGISEEIARRCAGRSIMVNTLTKDNQTLVEALMAKAKDVFIADGFSTRVQ